MSSQIHSFLSRTRSILANGFCQSGVCKIVLGNEACDLDSTVSSITYAYLLHSLDKSMQFGVVVPVLNIPRKDFPLRTEVNYWLNSFSVLEDTLIFRDEIDLMALANEGNLQLYLVDHNILTPSDVSLEPYVVSALDHHQLERTDTPVYGMTVEPVGSCATLVTSEYVNKCLGVMDEVIANLLYGTILLDTINLSEIAKRTTPKDVTMLQYLESFLKYDQSKRSSVYEGLISAKSDISHLNSEQIFRKDVKIVTANNICVALASVPLLVKKYMAREDISECLRLIAEKNGYDVVVVLGIDVSGEVERDLAVVSHRKSLKEELSSFLTRSKSELLKLERLYEISLRDANVFDQKNTAASRKVVLPMVKDWLESKK